MQWTDREISSWLEELLPPERMAQLETALREDEHLRVRVAQMIRHRDQGGQTVGEIWQRARLSCPSRSELAGFQLGTLPSALSDYVDFHLKTVGCRFCLASFYDIQEKQSSPEDAPRRRQRIFESSAGIFRNQSSDEP